jgi:hypothetical protein
MLLNTDYIEPAELTGFARAAAQDLDINQFTLSRWLPNRLVDDLEYRFARGGEGLAEAATFRAYDAESPIGSRPGISRVTGELPPISRKIRLSEYDRLRQRKLENAVGNAIESDAERMVRSVAARLELARGQALVTGKVTLNENGVIAEADFGRTAGHTVTAAASWATASTDVIGDLNTWRETYVENTGQEPGSFLTSRRVMGYLLRNEAFRQLDATVAGTPTIVTPESVNNVLSAHDLPPIVTYDARVRVNGTAQRVIADDKFLMLPAVGSGEMGATLYGTTAESMEPEFGLAGSEAGIVAGAYSTKDPVALWTKAAAIAMPILANPDLSFVADVIP